MEDATAAHGPLPCLLIVDDDPVSVVQLQRVLEGQARIAVATSGEEALNEIHAHAPDLVLLDAAMPGRCGFDICMAIKSDPATADLPVIFITGQTSTESETRALTIGAIDFIRKPGDPAVVRARVRAHLALKRKTDELRRLTTVDGLTGIANRRAFDELLGIEWRRAMRHQQPLSLLLADIDHFKLYNDAYGHVAGDACLRQVAQTISASTQRAGELAARFGGEEFAVILPHLGAAQAQEFAQRLCAAIEAQGIAHAASPVAAHVTVSIGVASVVCPCTADTSKTAKCSDCDCFEHCRHAADALIALADGALYIAKRNGRAQVASQVGSADAVLHAVGRL